MISNQSVDIINDIEVVSRSVRKNLSYIKICDLNKIVDDIFLRILNIDESRVHDDINKFLTLQYSHLVALLKIYSQLSQLRNASGWHHQKILLLTFLDVMFYDGKASENYPRHHGMQCAKQYGFFTGTSIEDDFRLFFELISQENYKTTLPSYVKEIIDQKDVCYDVLVFEFMQIYSKTNAKDFLMINGETFEFNFWLNNVKFELKTDIVDIYNSRKFVLFNDIFRLTCKIIRKYMSKVIFYKNACDERALVHLYNDLWPTNCLGMIEGDTKMRAISKLEGLQVEKFISNSTFYQFNNYCYNGRNPSVLENFETVIVGINYRNEDGVLRKLILCNIPTRCNVDLIRERENIHDENAVSIHYRSKKLGYLPKETARDVSLLIDAGYQHAQSLCVYRYNTENDEFIDEDVDDVSQLRVSTQLSIVFFDNFDTPIELKVV